MYDETYGVIYDVIIDKYLESIWRLYQLSEYIKSWGATFSGKYRWPNFTSFLSGHNPMDE